MRSKKKRRKSKMVRLKPLERLEVKLETIKIYESSDNNTTRQIANKLGYHEKLINRFIDEHLAEKIDRIRKNRGRKPEKEKEKEPNTVSLIMVGSEDLKTVSEILKAHEIAHDVKESNFKLELVYDSKINF